MKLIQMDGSGEITVNDGEIVYDWSSIYIKNINNTQNDITIGVNWVDKEDKELEGMFNLTICIDDKLYKVKV